MFIAATLSLLTTLAPHAQNASAQGGGDDPVLSERERKTLSDKLRKYLSADIAYDLAEGKARQKASKTRRKYKDAFDKDWQKAELKGVLGSMSDLRSVFSNCFSSPKPDHGKGTMYPRTIKGTPLAYGIFVPKKYKEKTPWPTLVVLPDGKAGVWTKPVDYFKKAWAGTGVADTCIIHVPKIPERLELDPVPDYSRQGAEAEENQRNGAVLGTFGFVMNNYNVDRARVYLDCGRESCGYGMRLASLFPDRFAGVILRDAITVDDIRIGNLLNLPVLLLKTGDNDANVSALKDRLDKTCPKMATVLDAKGAYPHLESAPEIEAWMAENKRGMTPMKITLEPNHDRFNKTYWVGLQVADSLLATVGDEQPRLEAVADREANRITIDSRGVERFEILLNDDLVDLDKEFTIVINGKAVKETRRRSFREMKQRMMDRNDWDYLFPVSYSTSVPKE